MKLLTLQKSFVDSFEELLIATKVYKNVQDEEEEQEEKYLEIDELYTKLDQEPSDINVRGDLVDIFFLTDFMNKSMLFFQTVLNI